MYFLHNFYSKSAWDSWLRDGRVGESDRIATSKVSPQDWRQMVQFDAVNTFDELVQRVAFLQLMNKRQVLYFRGEDKLYPTSLPSIFRGAGELEELQRRWRVLKAQSVVWRKLFVEGVHPRQRTLAHYPQALWAIQQHYKDHLRLHGVDA